MTGDPQSPRPDDAAELRVGKCIVCGCTDNAACEVAGQPCGWVNFNSTVCSSCVPPGIPDLIGMLHQVAEGALVASESQLQANDERGALRSRAMGGLMLGCGELLARCGAETVSDANALAAEEADPEREPSLPEDRYDVLIDELHGFMNRFMALAPMLAAPEQGSGLVDARGMPVSTLGGDRAGAGEDGPPRAR